MLRMEWWQTRIAVMCLWRSFQNKTAFRTVPFLMMEFIGVIICILIPLQMYFILLLSNI